MKTAGRGEPETRESGPAEGTERITCGPGEETFADPSRPGCPVGVALRLLGMGLEPTEPRGSGEDSDPSTFPSTSSAPLPDGTRPSVFGDYELNGVLGSGGMGIVYRARRISLNRPAALKLIKAHGPVGDAEVRRFQNEAEVVAKFDHIARARQLDLGLVDSLALARHADAGEAYSRAWSN